MKYWIDTEYDDSGSEVVLISLGAVSEDGREFYAVSTDFDPSLAKPWVVENVLPHLPSEDSPEWMSLQQMKDGFTSFIGSEPAEFWSLNPTYDWYLVTWNFLRGWDHLPENWQFECYDLGQWAFQLGVEIPSGDGVDAHIAISDAKYHRDVYRFLEAEQAKQRLAIMEGVAK